MTIYAVRLATSEQTRLLDPCGRGGPAGHADNKAFRHHHMGRLLRLLGSMLPQWLNGVELAHAARDIERMCWRELGYGKAPLFDGDVPPFLLHDENGRPTHGPLQEPIPPAELAARLTAMEPSAPPGSSPLETNLQVLTRLLNLMPAEGGWLLWSYCFTWFASPTISLRSEEHAWSVLAAVLDVSPDAIRNRGGSHRLQVMGMLRAPPLGLHGESRLLSDWLTCTSHFMNVMGAPHASAAALCSALQAHEVDGMSEGVNSNR
jgi:hypothetical protein